MTLQSSGAISIYDIKTNFNGQNADTYGYTNWGTTTYDLNFYRGKYRYKSGAWGLFSSGAITMNDFYGSDGNCNCVCDCDCACDCGPS